MKLRGFTLAEVLVTLVIIGVVSALTIPSVIVNYEKKQTVVKLKKEYQTFAEALNHAVRDYGQISAWKLESADQIVTDYLKPYLKIKDKKYPNRYQYKWLNGNSGYFNQNTVYFLEDGTAFYLEYNTNQAQWVGIKIDIDINGTKGPNIWGRDIFSFMLVSYYYRTGTPYLNRFEPYGIYSWATREQLMEDDNFKCTKANVGSAGTACAALIMKDGWKIKDDYPW